MANNHGKGFVKSKENASGIKYKTKPHECCKLKKLGFNGDQRIIGQVIYGINNTRLFYFDNITNHTGVKFRE